MSKSLRLLKSDTALRYEGKKKSHTNEAFYRAVDGGYGSTSITKIDRHGSAWVVSYVHSYESDLGKRGTVKTYRVGIVREDDKGNLRCCSSVIASEE